MDKLERVRNAQLALVKRELLAAEVLGERKASFVEATDRLEQLKALAGKFRQTQDNIEQEQENPESIASVHDHREEFNQAYYPARNLLEKYIADNNPEETGSSACGRTVVDGNYSELREAMRLLMITQRAMMENQRLAHVAGDQVPEVRLPAINVPMFNGERKNWISFKNIYVTTIHNRTDLEASLKMKYLVSYVDGYAKLLVNSYPISDAHYEEAWAALTNYYDKKKFTVFSLVREFVDQPGVITASTGGLRKLVTTSDEVLRQLNVLGDEFNARDPWLIHLLLDKLDEETRLLWAQQIVHVENPSVDDFLKFLNSRCDALETCAAFSMKATPQVTKTETEMQAVNNKTVQSLHLAIAAEKCAKCSKEHPVYRCDEFKKMDIKCKRKLVMQARLCYNCLGPSHMAKRCSSKSVCRTVGCGQRHHSLLCPQRKLQKQFITPILKPSSQPPRSTDVQIPVEVPRKALVLPTAVIRIRKNDGSLLPVRTLIDSGSEASLISETCFNKLGLPRSNDKIEVTGMGDRAAGTANGLVKLVISNRFSDAAVLQTSAYVVGNLTTALPTQQCEMHPKLLNKQLKGSLADPAYHRPGAIDLILGADAFLALLQPGQVKDNDGVPVAQNTIFGWVTSGNQARPEAPLQKGKLLSNSIGAGRTSPVQQCGRCTGST